MSDGVIIYIVSVLWHACSDHDFGIEQPQGDYYLQVQFCEILSVLLLYPIWNCMEVVRVDILTM